MDGEIRRLERRLLSSGVRCKVLDAAALDLLTEYFEEKLKETQARYGRFVVRGRQSERTQAAASAMEEMNKYARLLELLL